MSRIATFCADYIGDHGPMSVDELYQAAKAANVTTARTAGTVNQAMRERPEFVLLPDGRYTVASRLLAGCVFTHRVRDSRTVREGLWAGRELGPFQTLLAQLRELPTDTGGAISYSRYRPSVWDVPAGWLPEVSAGELLGLRWTGSQLQAARVEADEQRAAEVRAVLVRHRQRLDQERRHVYSPIVVDRFGDATEVALNALVEVPDLFAEPVPPLDELLGRTPAECVRELHQCLDESFEPYPQGRLSVDIPESLLGELNGRASRMGLPLAEYVTGLLATEAWRTAPRGSVVYRRREPEPWYDSDSYDGEDEPYGVRPVRPLRPVL